ncbi:putative selenate ABC transporter substrate-binding protein [Akkermansiaceae bacterium]|nr:putative selenate ABC transporter substrate-binding protein [bacterium]MDB4294308.1 putative selenate ABC transporter substrate-binding protein [Akkermansiaceae bacterium]
MANLDEGAGTQLFPATFAIAFFTNPSKVFQSAGHILRILLNKLMNSFKPGDRSISQMLKGCASCMLIAGAALALSSCGNKEDVADADAVLRFSAIPDTDTTAQAEKFKPVADYLAKELGVKVEFVPSAKYSASVEKFSNGDIQLAWFGGVSGVQARKAVDGAEAIACGAIDPNYKSYFIANKATGLVPTDSFPAAIANHTFTFGSTGSTSGRVMPTHFITEASGKSPEDFFTKKPIGFSGAHDKTAQQVADGTFDVGVLSYSAYDKFVAKNPEAAAKMQLIWQTPGYADYNFTAHPALEKQFGEGFTAKLQDAIVACEDPEVLEALRRKKMIKVKSSDFDNIAEVMKAVGLE